MWSRRGGPTVSSHAHARARRSAPAPARSRTRRVTGPGRLDTSNGSASMPVTALPARPSRGELGPRAGTVVEPQRKGGR